MKFLSSMQPRCAGTGEKAIAKVVKYCSKSDMEALDWLNSEYYVQWLYHTRCSRGVYQHRFLILVNDVSNSWPVFLSNLPYMRDLKKERWNGRY